MGSSEAIMGSTGWGQIGVQNEVLVGVQHATADMFTGGAQGVSVNNDAEIFADEAGHSGANYIDPGQPIFVTAAFIVPEHAKELVNKELTDFRSSHRPSRGQAIELKFGRAVGNPNTRDALAGLLDRLMDAGCEAVPDVWEKRFGIATRIVDALCDTDYNPAALDRLHPLNPSRREIAYFLDATLPDDALHAFARAYRAVDGAALRSARDRISLLARLGGQSEVADLISCCDVNELVDDCTPDTRHHRTLNFPSFLGILGMIDTALERMNRAGPFIFDEQEEFREPFHEAHGLLEEARVVDMVNGTSSFRMGFSRITGFRMESSTASLGLQAADALAAIVRSGLSNLDKLNTSSPTAHLMRRVFGMPEPVSGAHRFGVTARISAGEDLLQRFGSAMLAIEGSSGPPSTGRALGRS